MPKKRTAVTTAAKSKAGIKKPVVAGRKPPIGKALPPSLPADRRHRYFVWAYAFVSIGVLLGTSLFWAVLSTRLQHGNADQLVNSYLFEHAKTFQAATFPGAHTYLLKWPLFLLVRLFGSSSWALAACTVGAALATVAALAYTLYKIDGRPLVFGTLCLALASVLLLIPAQPYPGGLLPVNMAMLATRNVEYVLYTGSLVLLTRLPKIKSWGLWLALGAFSLLFASDRLFFTISAAGALLTLTVYAALRRWPLVRRAGYWLGVTLVTMAIAVGVLWLISATKLTHIGNQSTASPYGLTHSPHDLALGILYVVLGLLTNFGANPAVNATVVRNIPGEVWRGLWGVSGLSYSINALIFAVGSVAASSVLFAGLRRPKSKKNKKDSPPDLPALLAVMLLFSSLAAVAAFVFSNHYYAVDARYLTIVLFAVFVSLAVFLRTKQQIADKLLLTVGSIIIVGIGLGIPTALRTYQASRNALASTNSRNALVAQAMAHRPTTVLIGDYWRVVPIKSLDLKLSIMPLANCTTPRDVLSSQAWLPNLNKHGFAYLLSLDGSPADYPQCQINQIVAAYGRPNTSTLIAGSLDKPRELLLFYDNGIAKRAPRPPEVVSTIPATVLPIPISELPNATCPSETTVLNVVAHQDDDLLFTSPNLVHDIRAGHCVRTIYVTAGDGGSGDLYWLSREQGSEAAYSLMAGTNSIWVQRIVQLAAQEFVTVANPQGNPKLSLVFMRLPDGDIHGTGFAVSHYQSLAKLIGGTETGITSVDKQSIYSSGGLISALATLMQTYHPTVIRTQATYSTSPIFPDHSDHLTVGRYTERAYQQNADHVPIEYYIGYPIHQMPQNVWDGDLDAKEAAWLAYARFDDAVCQTVQICDATPTYGSYLTRQYQTQP